MLKIEYYKHFGNYYKMIVLDNIVCFYSINKKNIPDFKFQDHYLVNDYQRKLMENRFVCNRNNLKDSTYWLPNSDYYCTREEFKKALRNKIFNDKFLKHVI